MREEKTGVYIWGYVVIIVGCAREKQIQNGPHSAIFAHTMLHNKAFIRIPIHGIYNV